MQEIWANIDCHVQVKIPHQQNMLCAWQHDTVSLFHVSLHCVLNSYWNFPQNLPQPKRTFLIFPLIVGVNSKVVTH